ncbi:SSI family serine proteinase inhibitor [Streptomyces antimicrobicus]|uniref:Subtilase-type protease inhibitor n=1 Tax=Streptomyces antimicrobicus TaxID=2883108 RepID=A0ABS8B8T3_9ACTN|nr:SSI family serine proteinase inhibitor [Streptomyces antimicrobicus]MCB5181012.1 subtilase-type protease inhibitor [Streptomyces antimicrobicus]
MRSIVRGLGLASAAMGLTALTALAGSGVADAAPGDTQRLYAPSALVLTVSAGAVEGEQGTALRAVTLVCAPVPGGTHPAPAAACRELRQVRARFDAITVPPVSRPCTREWDPITVTAAGVWEGRHVNYAHTFANRCALRHGSGTLFAF